LKDPLAAAVVAITHSGFSMGRPLARKDWERFMTPQSEPDLSLPIFREALARLSHIAEDLERLAGKGIEAVTWYGEAYPSAWLSRLGIKAPPVMFMLGAASPIPARLLAVLGSRDASPPALEFAERCTEEAVRQGWGVVSGGARGVDLAAIRAACRAGGQAVVVAADALPELHRKLCRAGCQPERLALIGVSHPEAGFSVGQAMGRNKLVYALAEAAAIAACEERTGGTWAGAAEAIRSDLCAVGVWMGPGAPPGNAALAREGALVLAHPEDALGLAARKKQTSLFDS
jgi:predicted Rossmann fold nucleotide-binding protein DprA/Smf involved in DNA uptake